MSVFTSCWKHRKKGGASSTVALAAGPPLSHENRTPRDDSVLCLSRFHPLARIPPLELSLFARSRHTRRLIKSATKTSTHHRQAENGSLTDSPVELRVSPSLVSLLVAVFRPRRGVFPPRSFVRPRYGVFAAIVTRPRAHSAFLPANGEWRFAREFSMQFPVFSALPLAICGQLSQD